MHIPELQTGRFRIYIHVYQILKNRGPGPYNSLRHADNNFFFGSPSQNRRETHMFHVAREVEKLADVLAEKKVTLT